MVDRKVLVAELKRVMHLPPEESVKQIDRISNKPEELLNFIESISKSSTSPSKKAIIKYAGKSLVKYCKNQSVELDDILEIRKDTGHRYQVSDNQLVRQTYAQVITSVNSIMGKRMMSDQRK